MKNLALLFLITISGCLSNPDNHSDTKSQVEWGFNGFEKVDSLNPILQPSPLHSFKDPITGNELKWEERNVLNPTAVVKDNQVYLLYRAQDSSGTSRIGMATSKDGLHFTKRNAPVFYPDLDSMKLYEWNYKKDPDDTTNTDECYFCYFDGVEDPRIVQSADGRFIMTYTAYDGKTARLSLASSKDLIHWTKHGLILKSNKYHDLWSKSGAIIAEKNGNQIIAKQIDGKYWMYFGDTDLYMAQSKDLIHWEPLVNEESGELISVLHPRPGYFDSRLVEPGPFAFFTQNGIVLIYNASNAANYNDAGLPKFTYAAGQALFDGEQPYKLVDRKKSYFIYPNKPYEKVGEVNEVCFVEGLVPFNNQWYLYYGTADSKIAVAISNSER